MTWRRRDVLIGACGLAGAAGLPRIASAGDVATIGGAAFGTTWRVALADGVDSPALAGEIDRLLAELEAALSPFRSNSEITQINAGSSAGAIAVSRPLRDVLAEGLRIAQLTAGAFDPTVGPVVARFGFGPIAKSASQEHRIGDHRGLTVHGRYVTKCCPDLTFDPCGIGKGYALDRMAARLRARGISNFLAEFGGDVLASGRRPSGRPWRVGIENPAPTATRFRHVVGLDNGALATSGDTANVYVVGARRYSHIIDPRTAAPVNNTVASVSVIAPSAMAADALATALVVMGPESGAAFAERERIPALFVLRDGDGYREISAAAFGAHLIT